MELPNFDEIIKMENIAKENGSGISYQELIGTWRFQYVWKKGSSNIDNFSSSILQVLSASLELSKIDNENKKLFYEIKNSVKFGLFSIVFKGKAFLKGDRPLLPFDFDYFNINFGNINVYKKCLGKTESNRPFFALISIDNNQKWLCARGKGGGLAIWIKV